MKKIQISRLQFFAIIYSYIGANDLIRGIYGVKLENNIWVPIVLSIPMSVMIFFIYSFIYKNNNYNDFTTSIENIVGKFLSKIVFLLYSIYFIIMLFYNLRDLVELIQIYLLQNSPIIILSIVVLILVIYIIYAGIEPFARYNTFVLFGTVMFFGTFSILLVTFNDEHFDNFLPILENGIKEVIKPTLEMSYAVPFGELFVLLIIFQYVKYKKKSYRVGYLGIITAGFLLLTVTFFNVLYLSMASMTFGLNPSLRLWRRLDNDQFIQRFDLIVLNILFLHSIVKLTIYTHASKLLINKVVKIRKKNIIAIIICVAVLAGIFFYGNNYPEIFHFRRIYVIPYVNLGFEIILPFTLVLISFFRKSKAKKNPDLEEEEKIEQRKKQEKMAEKETKKQKSALES